MRRFFGSSSIVRRIPPGAPSFVKEVPIPRTTKTTADVEKVLGQEVRPTGESSPIQSKYMSSVVSDEISADKLASPEGVWYHVERSRAGNSPVYLDYNNAGGVWTEIRKIAGNAGASRNDSKIKSNSPKSDIWVKNAANCVVIKGDHRREVKEALKEAF